jgi:hypothetical protein
MPEKPMLSGGPLNLDPKVAEAFLAQIEMLAYADGAAFEAAQQRRTDAFRALDKQQRENVLFVTSSMARLASAPV